MTEERQATTPTRFFLLGATCTGKSAVGARVASLLGAEVISMDSMQVYGELPVLTAQPGPGERALAAHHLVGCVDPACDFDVFSYLELVSGILRELDERGVPALFVGGTTYYFTALVDGFDELPPGSKEEREAIVAEYGEDSHRLHQALAAIDPASAARIHRNDRKKIIRAIEVFRLSGRPMSSLLGGDRKPLVRNFAACAITMDRRELYSRIDARVDEMIRSGAMDEVRRLFDNLGPDADLTIHQALGVRQLGAAVRGELDLDEAVALLKRDTRRFAKRQMSFLRREQRLKDFDWADFDGPDSMAAAMAAWFESRRGR